MPYNAIQFDNNRIYLKSCHVFPLRQSSTQTGGGCDPATNAQFVKKLTPCDFKLGLLCPGKTAQVSVKIVF
jgi:hypothetical protein